MQPIYRPADQGGPPPSAPPPPNSPGRRGGLIAVVAATALISAGLGTAIGALAIKPSSPDAAPQAVDAGTPASGDTHAQDVALCTRYAIVNGAMPSRDVKASDLLPGVTALETALQEFPDASAEIREAVAGMVSAYYARMAAYGPIRARGLAEPPVHSTEIEKAASDKAWQICGLDEG